MEEIKDEPAVLLAGALDAVADGLTALWARVEVSPVSRLRRLAVAIDHRQTVYLYASDCERMGPALTTIASALRSPR